MRGLLSLSALALALAWAPRQASHAPRVVLAADRLKDANIPKRRRSAVADAAAAVAEERTDIDPPVISGWQRVDAELAAYERRMAELMSDVDEDDDVATTASRAGRDGSVDAPDSE